MTLAIGWLHDGGETVGTWLHQPGDWHGVRRREGTDAPSGAVDLVLHDGEDASVLRVQDERLPVHGADSKSPYKKGRTPVWEIRVNDADAWIERAVQAGTRVEVRLRTCA